MPGAEGIISDVKAVTGDAVILHRNLRKYHSILLSMVRDRGGCKSIIEYKILAPNYNYPIRLISVRIDDLAPELFLEMVKCCNFIATLQSLKIQADIDSKAEPHDKSFFIADWRHKDLITIGVITLPAIILAAREGKTFTVSFNIHDVATDLEKYKLFFGKFTTISQAYHFVIPLSPLAKWLKKVFDVQQ